MQVFSYLLQHPLSHRETPMYDVVIGVDRFCTHQPKEDGAYAVPPSANFDDDFVVYIEQFVDLAQVLSHAKHARANLFRTEGFAQSLEKMVDSFSARQQGEYALYKNLKTPHLCSPSSLMCNWNS